MSKNKIFNDNNSIILFQDTLEIELKEIFSKLTNTPYNEGKDILIVDVSIQPAVAKSNSDFVKVIIDKKGLFIDFLKACDTENRLIDINFIDNKLWFINQHVDSDERVKFKYDDLSTGTKQLVILFYYFLKLITNKKYIILIVNLYLHTLLYNYLRKMFDENTNYKSIIFVTNTDFINIRHSTIFNNKTEDSIISVTELLNIIDGE